MKSTLLLLFVTVFFVLNCNAAPKKKGDKKEKGAINALTSEEKTQGWLLMFDGKTSEGWKGYNKPNFHAGWIIENGTLKCQDSGRGEAGAANGGDIIYAKQKFSNFHLKIEWKISQGGNSGIFYLGKEVEGWEIYRTAPEMQILDNERHPDAKLGVDGNRMAGSLYDLIPAKPQNTKPSGEWNHVHILCYQGTVVYSQNGANVVEYHLWTEDWKKMVANSKFKDWEWFVNQAKEGYIGLQDHGNDVWFRNIKLKTL